jgi:hypothetical protein
MWKLDYSSLINASPVAICRIYQNVSKWQEWDTSLFEKEKYYEQ